MVDVSIHRSLRFLSPVALAFSQSLRCQHASLCTGAFGRTTLDSATANGADSPVLMVEQTDEEGVRTGHKAVPADGVPPFLCHELCRYEVCNVNCINGRSLHQNTLSRC